MTTTTTKTITNSQLAEFLDYVHHWYGKGGLYDMGATHMQIWEATKRYLREPAHYEQFTGETEDRCTVRFLLEDMFGLAEVAKQ